MKRLLAFLLAVAMTFSIVMPSLAAAYEAPVDESASAQEEYIGESSGLSTQEEDSAPPQEEHAEEHSDAPAQEERVKDSSDDPAPDQSAGEDSVPSREHPAERSGAEESTDLSAQDKGAEESASVSAQEKSAQEATEAEPETQSAAAASSASAPEEADGSADSSQQDGSGSKGEESGKEDSSSKADASQADGSADPGPDSSSAESSSSASGDASVSTDPGTDPEALPQGPESSAPAMQKSLQASLKTVDGVRYTFTVSYGEDAEIPDGAKLSIVEINQALTEEEKALEENKKRPFDTEKFISGKALEQETFDLLQGLEVREQDYLLFAKFLDLTLTADGKTIQPKAPVIVTLETDVVAEGASDALELACYDKDATQQWKEELKKLREEREARIRAGKVVEVEQRQKEKVYTVLATANETKKGQGVQLTYQAEEFGRLGVAGAAKLLKSWRVKGESLRVYGPRRRKAKIQSETMKRPEAGLEKVRAFSVVTKGEDLPDYDITYWVGTQDSSLTPQSAEDAPLPEDDEMGLVACKLKNGKTGAQLIGTGGAAAPVAIQEGDQVGLLWDTGLREQSIQAEKVTLAGLLPKNAQVEANDVLSQCADAGQINENAEPGAQTLAAYDITITGKNGQFQPEEGERVSVSIQTSGVDESKRLEVWHVLDDGSVEVIQNVDVKGDLVSFDAEGFSVYMVVQITKEQILTASDGNAYKITVTYDSDAGIPEDAELSVSEFASDSKEYKKYVKKAAKKLDKEVENLTFAHTFDIALVNPESGERYQPAKNVKVSVKLLGEDVEEDSSIKVVHFGDETEVLESSVKGESIEFETDGFSVYVVAGTAPELRTQSGEGSSTPVDPVTITFVSDEETVDVRTVEKNQPVGTLPEALEKTDYQFKGWYVDETLITETSTFSADTTVTARYAEEYVISFSVIISCFVTASPLERKTRLELATLLRQKLRFSRNPVPLVLRFRVLKRDLHPL